MKALSPFIQRKKMPAPSFLKMHSFGNGFML